MDISKIYALFNKYKSVSIDTRSIKPNDIFFAIKGPNFDGNYNSDLYKNYIKYKTLDEVLRNEQKCQKGTLQNLSLIHI